VKIGLALEQVSASERQLAKELIAVAGRHRTDHDVHHVCRRLAAMSDAHVMALARFGERYGASLDAESASGDPSVLSTVREKGAELLGRRPEPSLLLLRDLRTLHLMATEASINWVMLAQGAQAARDSKLLEVVSECHAETLRQLRWTTTRVKEAAPQALLA
jgi:hypothetical protein